MNTVKKISLCIEHLSPRASGSGPQFLQSKRMSAGTVHSLQCSLYVPADGARRFWDATFSRDCIACSFDQCWALPPGDVICLLQHILCPSPEVWSSFLCHLESLPRFASGKSIKHLKKHHFQCSSPWTTVLDSNSGSQNWRKQEPALQKDYIRCLPTVLCRRDERQARIFYSTSTLPPTSQSYHSEPLWGDRSSFYHSHTMVKCLLTVPSWELV